MSCGLSVGAILGQILPEKDICIVKLAEWGTNKEVNLNYFIESKKFIDFNF